MIKINKKEKVINPYAGYIFVEMIMTDETWYMVRNTPGVTGICGSSGGGTKPTPVPNSEIQAVLLRCGIRDEEMIAKFKVGDKVRIIGGTFTGEEGEISKMVTEDDKVVKVMVDIIFFNKYQSVEVDLTDIEIISQ